MPPEEHEVVLWLRKAAHDRLAAELAIKSDPAIPDVAAFHCQQAVEKLLKAFLVYRSCQFEKIHDLRALVNLCAELDPGFFVLRDRVAPLTAYAVRFRYPGPVEPTIDQARHAVEIIHEVEAFILDRLPPNLPT
jgi:HEPN domain-containing protein